MFVMRFRGPSPIIIIFTQRSIPPVAQLFVGPKKNAVSIQSRTVFFYPRVKDFFHFDSGDRIKFASETNYFDLNLITLRGFLIMNLLSKESGKCFHVLKVYL